MVGWVNVALDCRFSNVDVQYDWTRIGFDTKHSLFSHPLSPANNLSRNIARCKFSFTRTVQITPLHNLVLHR